MSHPTPVQQKHQIAVEEDLDDLDDVLEQFAPVHTKPTKPASLPGVSVGDTTDSLVLPPPPPPTASVGTDAFVTPKHATTLGAVPEDLLQDIAEDADFESQFAAELAKGMEGLMRDLGSGDPGVAGGSQLDPEEQKKFKAAWEAMLVEGLNGVDPGTPAGTTFEGVAPPPPTAVPGGSASFKQPATTDGSATPKPFASTIQAAVNKLKDSEATLKPPTAKKGGASAKPDANIDFEKLLASLGGIEGLDGLDLGALGDIEKLAEELGAGGTDADDDDEGNEEELEGMLESMMGQLMSRDVLEEPIRELGEKYPEYLSTHPNLPPADRARYDAQLSVVRKILALFDKDKEESTDKDELVRLMTEMQGHGSPPPEIMGPMSLPGTGVDGEQCIVC